MLKGIYSLASVLFTLVMGSVSFLGLAGAPAVFAADMTAAQKIVISIKRDLYTEGGHESACVAAAMGTMLSTNGADVTIFASLDGVEVANQRTLGYVDLYAANVGNWSCTTNSGELPLGTLVSGFVSAGGSILACPLCWTKRFGMDAGSELVTGASVGTSSSFATLFLDADKVIDF